MIINRRDFVAGAAAVSLATPAIARSKPAPNILFLPIDDLNDWIEPLGGYPGVSTPNFKRLARHSLGFTRAYSPVPVCQAARSAILFSVPAHHSGVYTHRTGDWVDSKLADKDKYQSIVRRFRNHDYETVGLGKVFHDGWRKPGVRNEANDITAWDQFNYCDGSDDCKAILDGGEEDFRYGPIDRPNKKMEDVERANWLVKNVLSKKSGKPFFAAFGMRKPHLPFNVPSEWFKMYPMGKVNYPLGAIDPSHSTLATNEDVADLPPEGIDMVRQFYADHLRIVGNHEWRKVIQSYLAAVSFADHVLGLLLDGLYKGPNAENTYICVWSDHGWQLGEKLSWRKFTLWERALRVPLFIGGPGIKPGISDAPVSTLDLYPTLTNLAYGETPNRVEGISLAEHCRDRSIAPLRNYALSTWALGEQIHHSIRTDKHRLIAYHKGGVELYDHDVDPFEITNLAKDPASQNTAVIERLMKYVPTDNVPEVMRKQGQMELD